MVAYVLVVLKILIGTHEATHRLATVGKPVSNHRAGNIRTHFTEKVMEQAREDTIQDFR